MPAIPKWLRVIFRVAILVFVTYAFGWVLNFSTTRFGGEREAVAGFGTGILHGALMPGAFPSLLVGKDIVIYAPKNEGRLYKLGYTLGVNACGALFFGVFYWRLNRWRKMLK